jgi:hypothetical protein
MSYSVGKKDDETVLIVGVPGGGGYTSTMTMGEGATVQLIKLLAATLDNYGCEIYPHININEINNEH